MKIGLAVFGSLETLSGSYLYDRKMVDYLQSKGDDVQILTFPWHNYFFDLSESFIRSYLDRFYELEIDILILDELHHPYFPWMNRRLIEKTKYPIISVIHQLRTSENHKKNLKWVFRQVEKIYLKSVDGYIFNSQATKRAVQALCGEKVNGVVAYPSGSRFDVDLNVHQIVQRAHDGPLRLLFVGNIIPRKGLHTLVNALSLLRDMEWELEIIGRLDLAPEYVMDIRKTIEKNHLFKKIKFAGKISNQALFDMYRRSHVLAVPSTYEGFGIVYLEAMSFGVVPVATTAGGAREIISSGNDGYLIPVDGVENLAEKLGRIYSDRNLLAAMSVGAFHKYKQYPTWEETGERIRQFLKDQIDR